MLEFGVSVFLVSRWTSVFPHGSRGVVVICSAVCALDRMRLHVDWRKEDYFSMCGAVNWHWCAFTRFCSGYFGREIF